VSHRWGDPGACTSSRSCSVRSRPFPWSWGLPHRKSRAAAARRIRPTRRTRLLEPWLAVRSSSQRVVCGSGSFALGPFSSAPPACRPSVLSLHHPRAISQVCCPSPLWVGSRFGGSCAVQASQHGFGQRGHSAPPVISAPRAWCVDEPSPLALLRDPLRASTSSTRARSASRHCFQELARRPARRAGLLLPGYPTRPWLTGRSVSGPLFAPLFGPIPLSSRCVIVYAAVDDAHRPTSGSASRSGCAC
jgi:hypothetical protein